MGATPAIQPARGDIEGSQPPHPKHRRSERFSQHEDESDPPTFPDATFATNNTAIGRANGTQHTSSQLRGSSRQEQGPEQHSAIQPAKDNETNSTQTDEYTWTTTTQYQRGQENLPPARTKWFPYVVPRVPKQLWTAAGVKPTEEFLDQEIEAITKMKPTRIQTSKFNDTTNYHDLIIFLPRQHRPGFRIFDSRPARAMGSNARIIQCMLCMGFHGPKPCQARPRCEGCGNTATSCHCKDLTIPRCANCRGPHKATSLDCPARPKTTAQGLERHTKTHLKAIRALGGSAYQEATKRQEESFTPANSPPPEGAPRAEASTEALLTTIPPL